jgi:hypothetical protein
MWGRATEDERHQVVAAFTSTSCKRYDTVQLSNAFVSDRLAVRMADLTPTLTPTLPLTPNPNP